MIQAMARHHQSQWILLGLALLLTGSVMGWNRYAGRNAVDAAERERPAHQATVMTAIVHATGRYSRYAIGRPVTSVQAPVLRGKEYP